MKGVFDQPNVKSSMGFDSGKSQKTIKPHHWPRFLRLVAGKFLLVVFLMFVFQFFLGCGCICFPFGSRSFREMCSPKIDSSHVFYVKSIFACMAKVPVDKTNVFYLGSTSNPATLTNEGAWLFPTQQCEYPGGDWHPLGGGVNLHQKDPKPKLTTWLA